MATKTLPEYVFTIAVTAQQFAEPVNAAVQAAYFINEDGFHILKDGAHTPVYAVRNEVLVSIHRGASA